MHVWQQSNKIDGNSSNAKLFEVEKYAGLDGDVQWQDQPPASKRLLNLLPDQFISCQDRKTCPKRSILALINFQNYFQKTSSKWSIPNY